jgi:hypothetical protein
MRTYVRGRKRKIKKGKKEREKKKKTYIPTYLDAAGHPVPSEQSALARACTWTTRGPRYCASASRGKIAREPFGSRLPSGCLDAKNRVSPGRMLRRD